MVAEVVAILALILASGAEVLRAPLYWIGQAELWVVIVTALWSAFDYFRRFNIVLNPRIADFAAARDLHSDTRKAG